MIQLPPLCCRLHPNFLILNGPEIALPHDVVLVYLHNHSQFDVTRRGNIDDKDDLSNWFILYWMRLALLEIGSEVIAVKAVSLADELKVLKNFRDDALDNFKASQFSQDLGRHTERRQRTLELKWLDQ